MLFLRLRLIGGRRAMSATWRANSRFWERKRREGDGLRYDLALSFSDRFTRSDRHQHAVANHIVLSSPPDGLADKACHPDEAGKGVPQRYKDQLLPYTALLESPGAH